MRPGERLLLSLACLLCLGDLALGQFPGGGPFGGRGGPGGGPGGEDFRRRILERMDRNGNGVVEPDEVDDRARGFIQQMARDSGLDPNRPLPVNRLSGAGGGGGDRNRGGNRGGRDNTRRSESQTEYTLVPGFGETTIAGFGVNPLSLDGQVVDLEKRYDRGVLENVDRTLERYDRNKSGILEYDEWKGVSWGEDPRQADVDGDGRLTKAEIAERLNKRETEQRQQRDRGRGGPQGGRGGPGFMFAGPGGMMMGPGGPGGMMMGPGAMFMGPGGPGGMMMGPGGPGGMFPGRGGPGEGDDQGRGRRGRGGDEQGGRGGDRGPGGEQGPGGDRGPFGRGGFDPTQLIARFDPDGDGVIKLDELDDRMRMGATFMLQRMGVNTEQPIKIDEVRKRIEEQAAQRGRGRQGAQAQQKQPSRDAYQVTGSDRLKGRKSYASTARHLPENLPGWWKDRDKNEDGQITMSEFSAGVTAKTRDEFLEYDLNDDGFITAQEAKGAAKQ